jgi:F-type H+-transporting ATPase subunit b
VLRARYEATEGAQKRAAESLQKAADRTAEYEAALRAARAEVYQSQEQLHQRLQEEHATQIQAAREEADAALREAREQLAAEVLQAKAGLAAQSDALAGQIADAILNRGAVA